MDLKKIGLILLLVLVALPLLVVLIPFALIGVLWWIPYQVCEVKRQKNYNKQNAKFKLIKSLPINLRMNYIHEDFN